MTVHSGQQNDSKGSNFIDQFNNVWSTGRKTLNFEEIVSEEIKNYLRDQLWRNEENEKWLVGLIKSKLDKMTDEYLERIIKDIVNARLSER